MPKYSRRLRHGRPTKIDPDLTPDAFDLYCLKSSPELASFVNYSNQLNVSN
jgi:hypothetical protein